MDAIYTETTENGLVIKIYPEEFPFDPRDEIDHETEMLCWHGRYQLGDGHDYASPQDLLEDLEKDAEILPLYLFDHSGLRISTSDAIFRAFDSHGWDWGQVGFIFMRPNVIRKFFAIKRITQKHREKIRKMMVLEIETYDDYLADHVYGFVIEDQQGEHIDSLGGFYGNYEESGCLNDAREAALLSQNIFPEVGIK